MSHRTSAALAGRLSALFLAAFAPALGHASAYRVEARTEAAFYEQRSYRGASADAPVTLPRRRIVQYLGFGGFELVKDEDLSVAANLRLYADLGTPSREYDRLDGGGDDVNLMTAAVTWRNAGGLGDLKFGRQMIVDELDFLAVDGVRASARLPLHVGVEAYGGLVVQGSSPLGSPTFSPDGVRESDQRRLKLGVFGADSQAGALEPVYGVRVSSVNVKYVSARLGYRRALLVPTGEADAYGKAVLRTDLERLGAALDVRPVAGLDVYGGADVDLIKRALGQGRAGARWDDDVFGVMAEALRLAPVLSADSIWYYFATGARDEARVRADFHPRALPVHPHLGYTWQRYDSNLQDQFKEAVAASPQAIPTNVAHALVAGLALNPSLGRAALDAFWRNGYGGRQLWLDLTAGHTFEGSNLSVDGRVSQAFVRDVYNPRLEGQSTGLQLLAGYQLLAGARLTVIGEENLGTFSRTDLRLYAVIDIRADL